MVGAHSVLIREVSVIQSVPYREVLLYVHGKQGAIELTSQSDEQVLNTADMFAADIHMHIQWECEFCHFVLFVN